MSEESDVDKLYRIAFGFSPKNSKHTRKEFNEYIKKYYPQLSAMLKEWWQKRYLFVNGYKELCVTSKLVDYVISKRNSPV